MPGISVSRGPKPLELCQGASYQCRAFHLQKKVGGFTDIGFSKLLSCLTWHDGGHSRVCVSIERKSPASWHHMSSAHSRFVERQIPAKINYYHSISQVLYSSPTRTINVFPYFSPQPPSVPGCWEHPGASRGHPTEGGRGWDAAEGAVKSKRGPGREPKSFGWFFGWFFGDSCDLLVIFLCIFFGSEFWRTQVYTKKTYICGIVGNQLEYLWEFQDEYETNTNRFLVQSCGS